MKIKNYQKFLEKSSSNEIADILLFRELLKKMSLKKNSYIKEEADWSKEYVNDYHRELSNKIEEKEKAKQKELEEKFPELLKISEEAIKIESDAFKSVGKETAERFEKFMEELTSTQGFQAAMAVFSKVIKEIGVIKCFKMVKSYISLFSKFREIEKKISKILPKGERYNLPPVGVIVGGENDSEVDDIISKIKSALTVKNLMKILTGKTDELEVEYMRKKGGEASGELKNIEIKDDGTVEVSIENDSVGVIKKDLTEITGAEKEKESDDEVDLQNKMTDIIKNKPDEVKRILNFTNFISDEKNKDNINKIEKIIGIEKK
jgi:flagellar hook protein FlgE